MEQHSPDWADGLVDHQIADALDDTAPAAAEDPGDRVDDLPPRWSETPQIVHAGPVQLTPTSDAPTAAAGDEPRYLLDGSALVEDITPQPAGEQAADETITVDTAAYDPAPPLAPIMAQVLATLDAIAAAGDGMLPDEVADMARDIRGALAPMHRLVTADVVLRTDGKQFDARIDGGIVPWPLYLDRPLQVHYLPGNGLAVVNLPIIAHRVRVVDERGERQAPRMPGEPDPAAGVDLADKAATQQAAHRLPWPGGNGGRKGRKNRRG
jgi:hypothetical protein